MVQLRNPQFFSEFIVRQNLARFGTNLYHHPEPFWFYVPMALLACGPWAVFAAAAFVEAVRKFRDRGADTLRAFLVIWIVVTIVFFSLSRSKLPGYILPAIPAAIVLLAEYVRERIGSRPPAGMAVLHSTASGAFVLSALLMPYVVMRLPIPRGPALLFPLGLSAAIVAVMTVSLRKFGYRSLRRLTLAPALLVMGVALRWGAPALDLKLSARPVAKTLRAAVPQPLPLAVFLVRRETEYGLQFYCDQAVPRYELGQVPEGEHLVVAAQGSQLGVEAHVPNRRVTYLGNFASQKLEYFYVAASPKQ